MLSLLRQLPRCVQVCDVTAKKVNTLEGHSARVGALAWNGDLLSSGSRDRLILQVSGNLNISEYKAIFS